MLDLRGMLCTQFFATDCMYRPQNNPLLDWFIYNGRTKIFGKQISSRDMRSLVNSIKAKHVIWYSPDQDYGLKQGRSEEHTSELQSREKLVCRLLLEKK